MDEVAERANAYEANLTQFASEMGYASIGEVPEVGRATTRHLLAELKARGALQRDVDGTILSAYASQGLETLSKRTLDYREVS